MAGPGNQHCANCIGAGFVPYALNCVVQVNKYVGPPYRRTKIYAARVSYTSNDAHRPPLHSFAATEHFAPHALLLGQTDRRTDGRTQHRLTRLTRSA